MVCVLQTDSTGRMHRAFGRLHMIKTVRRRQDGTPNEKSLGEMMNTHIFHSMVGVREHLRLGANLGRIGVFACTPRLRGWAGGSLSCQRIGADTYSPSLSVKHRCTLGVVISIATVSMAVAGPKMDGSPERAKTSLNPGLKQIGTITPRSADQISGSNWTLGCETLDRDFADYQQYKDYIVPLGIKTIRLQGGWAKTEKVKGVYDFAWLDALIDDARGRGLNILLETDYGNPDIRGWGRF